MKLAGYTTAFFHDEAGLLVHRGTRDADGAAVIVAAPSARHHLADAVTRLEAAYALREHLDRTFATVPLELRVQGGLPHLVMHDPGGVLLASLVGRPLPIGDALRIAIGIADALAHLHGARLTHRDVHPGTILVDPGAGRAWLGGLGLVSREPRQRQAHVAPEVVAGTLPYMAPEQTGRMNRSLDARADLYAFGVTLYQMLTGGLPFHATDPIGWVHGHIAMVPPPPHERTPEVPRALSAIVAKLLAKAAEDRYQTASGAAHDLRACLVDWEAHRTIAPFPLAREDASDRLFVPEKLYGREAEVAELSRAFSRVAADTTPLVLVSGHAGVGKSAVVQEMRRLLPAHALFAAGKSDQYERDIPYSTLAEALRSLVRSLLAQSEAELGPWRAAIASAVGPNGVLVVALVPELELVLGAQAAVPELAPQDTKARFHGVFSRFLGVFARAEHPLVLFLDDLQWVDAATLSLLVELVVRREPGHLLVVGAYRDNEVGESHPLALALGSIRASGASVESLVVGPLGVAELAPLVTDVLHFAEDRARSLARLVHEKTGGNPFFATQFLLALADEGLLAFDPAARAWTWDEAKVRAARHTDNVVALMVERLSRLPSSTSDVLQRFACLGASASVDALARACERGAEAIHEALRDAVEAGIVARTGATYAFVHDRVQEAAYSLMAEGARAELHLRVGRALLAALPDAPDADQLFDLLRHYDRAVTLVTDPAERATLSRLNERAGQRALAAIAYDGARTYMTHAAALLPESAWEDDYEATFATFLSLSECEFLAGDFEAAERRFDRLRERARTDGDRVKVGVLRSKLLQMQGRYEAGLEVAFEALRLFGVVIPTTDAAIDEETAAETARVEELLRGATVASLVDASASEDPRARAIVDLLVDAAPPVYASRPKLLPLLVLRALGQSLVHGVTDQSAFVYAWYALLLALRGEIDRAYQLSEAAARLNERFDNRRLRGPLLFFRGSYVHFWKHPFRESAALLEQAFAACNEVGEVFFSAFLGLLHVWQSFESGAPLEQVLRLTHPYAAVVAHGRNPVVQEIVQNEQRLLRALMGQTRTGSLGAASLDEDEAGKLATDRGPTSGLAFREVLRQMLAYHGGDPAASLRAADAATAHVADMMGVPPEATHYFYRALAILALHDEASPDEREERAPFVASVIEKHTRWAGHSPANYAHRLAILRAEVARTEGRVVDAMGHYEEAVAAARTSEAVQFEALANELAGAFHAARGFDTVAAAYLREARSCYGRWGAAAKVRLLDRAYPRLLRATSTPESASFGAPVEHLDLATVIEVSRAVSGEKQLGRLVETLVRLALEHAGAQRAALVLGAGEGATIVAEATTGRDGLAMSHDPRAPTSALLPMSLLHYVQRTHEVVVLDDAMATGEHTLDEYVRRERSRSVMCLPLLNQNRLVGALYLENALASHAFTAARSAVLKLIASQAAISVENARLYSDLRQAQAYMAQAEGLSQTGTLSFGTTTGAVFWSEEIYRIYEHDRAVAPSMEIAWGRTHPDDAAKVHDEVARALREGTDLRLELRIRTPSGAIKHLSLVASPVRDRTGATVEYVGALQDVTAQKLAAEALAATQTALAHVARVATLGEVGASITHEVNQPLSAISTSCSACVRWLDAAEPNLAEARLAAQRASRDARRTSEIIGRLRDLFKRSGADPRPLDLNEAIEEVLVLLRGQIRQHATELRTELAAALPPIVGDRVQLQQVVMNLVLNGAEAMSRVDDRPRELVVRTEAVDGGVRVTVRDAGPGIEATDMERVFQPFHTTKSGGMGMGLSISRTIVQSHRGALRAERNEGHGTTFVVSLPTE